MAPRRNMQIQDLPQRARRRLEDAENCGPRKKEKGPGKNPGLCVLEVRGVGNQKAPTTARDELPASIRKGAAFRRLSER
jgi:hypothetical protein